VSTTTILHLRCVSCDKPLGEVTLRSREYRKVTCACGKEVVLMVSERGILHYFEERKT
jgi:DNA polymerase II large subunit